jgi:hypothetical protein
LLKARTKKRIRLGPYFAVRGGGVVLGPLEGAGGWFSGFDRAWDFAADDLYGEAVAPTDTHAQAIMVPDSNGLYVSKGANVLVRTDIGLQVSPTRTNVMLRSTNMQSSGGWSGGGAIITLNDGIAPDGTATAALWADNDAGNPLYRNQQINSVAGNSEVWTCSIFIPKDAIPATTRYVRMDWQFLGGTTLRKAVSLDTMTGAVAIQNVSGAPVTVGYGAIDCGTHWRLWMANTNNATGNVNVDITFYPAVGANANLTSVNVATVGSCHVAWAQGELGAYPSPPILTTTAPLTVAGNQQVVDLTALSGQSESFVIDGRLLFSVDGDVIWSRNDGTADDWYGLVRHGTKLDFRVIAGGVTQADIELGDLPTDEFTVAGAVGANYAKARLVGAADTTADTTVTLPDVTQMAFFGDGYAVTRNAHGFTRRAALLAGAGAAAGYLSAYEKALTIAALPDPF